MIIDFDNADSVQKNIKDYILENARDFTCEQYDNLIDRYSLCKSLNDDVIRIHRDWFNTQLRGSKICAGHFSRVYDLSKIEQGIVTLDCENHLAQIKDILNIENFEDKKEIDALEEILLNLSKYLGGIREKRLSFFYPASHTRACAHYTEAIGGEVIKFNKEKIPNIYQLLCKVGIPILVRATVPFDEIIDYWKGQVIDNIIRMTLAGEPIWKGELDGRCFELQIENCLKKKNIKEVIILG
ncbi:MAG: hypothetical protein IJB73_08735 [Firmicutes bacterium]|nr:hypothetical protein [Bacillota bacterium]